MLQPIILIPIILCNRALRLVGTSFYIMDVFVAGMLRAQISKSCMKDLGNRALFVFSL